MHVIIETSIGGALINIPSRPPMRRRAQTDSPQIPLRCSRIHGRCSRSDGLLFALKAVLTLGCKSLPPGMLPPPRVNKTRTTENKNLVIDIGTGANSFAREFHQAWSGEFHQAWSGEFHQA
ncbi:hypothetical protein CDAR_116151 [Caerostris darwini]|uniref:Uncharacterized protein n=1 Tax=Caerostris darwini TaxID=1538125 RepID=A0AAV4SM94_9ARAC|nr:hypothetical protein CDAR_116151 [Caerostris darwini]